MLLNTPLATEVRKIYAEQDIDNVMTMHVPNLLKVDSYKGEHWSVMNTDNDFVNAYIGFRKGEYVSVMGLQSAVSQILNFTVTDSMINLVERFAKAHGGPDVEFNREGFSAIVRDHGGKLPLEVKGLNEGSIAAVATPILNIRNSVKGYGWLVPYFLDSLMRLWKASSVATLCIETKVALYEAAKNCGHTHEEIMAWLSYANHDFGARSAGGTSEEAAESGTGHLLHFSGSDNWEATWRFLTLYGDSRDLIDMNLTSSSVYAMEHNVILSHDKDKEHDLLLSEAIRILKKGRIGSILIDTYDIDAALQYLIDNVGKLIEAWVEGGEKGKMVLRPDSGHPIDTPLSIVNKFGKLLGLFNNRASADDCILLPPWVGVIQGDEVDIDMLKAFGEKCRLYRISILNFVFGQGGKLLNSHTRDKGSFAGKVNAVERFGKIHKVCKNPKYGSGKKSLEGYHCILDEDSLTVSSIPVETYDDVEFPRYYFKDFKMVSVDNYQTLKDRAEESFIELLKYRNII